MLPVDCGLILLQTIETRSVAGEFGVPLNPPFLAQRGIHKVLVEE